ncbi:hypothetical protein SAMN05444169_7735 [Bradyrhizobium erythrophlei]|jgi:hypothetical protein|uniref:Uncharacterized protein n=1 Tax=Bradyrhizobium erythrophlei TaxID=1437360 RepID=A0A1M5TF17_9BRAD|nr:hypothetical protein SAMN05444169_7735 [Bradyrhizobium erythrophlei]
MWCDAGTAPIWSGFTIGHIGGIACRVRGSERGRLGFNLRRDRRFCYRPDRRCKDATAVN